MGENKNDIEIFDGEEDVIIETNDNVELYDIKGNIISADDAKNTLPDNTDLIQKAIDGDRQAFETLYMQSYRYVFFVIRQYIPDDETTYDVIQEAFIKVYKNISKLRSPAAYYGWLTAIAKNTARDFIRTARFETSLSYEEEDYSAFLKDDETHKDVSLDIETVLKEMDPAEAELLSLVYYDGMRISQIAKIQGVPATTVYSRFNKAKKNLKAQLNAHGIDKAIYSGNFISMVTVAMRNIIGTALLSVAIAQQILDSIINGKGKKEIAVAKIIKSQQKKSILKIAAVIVAISMITSAATALTLIDWSRFKFFGDENYLNETSTVTEYYYETDSDNGSSSNNGGGFWQNSFGGNTSLNAYDGSSNTNSSNSSYGSPYYSNNTSAESNNISQNGDVSTNQSINPSVPIVPDDNAVADEVINIYGNNPNHVMSEGGYITKQGDWLYVGGYNLIKVKTDGTQRQLLYETESVVSDVNVIGDTIYFVLKEHDTGNSRGVYSIKTDGSDFQIVSKKKAYNLLVRGTIGWFAEFDYCPFRSAPKNVSYNLYQINLSTGNTEELFSGKGYGLKTVVDNTLIYVDGNKFCSRDLNSGVENVMNEFDFMSGVTMMVANDDTFYFCGVSGDGKSIEIDITKPNVIQKTHQFRTIYNFFDYNGGTFFAMSNDLNTFYSLDGTALCAEQSIYFIYNFDDGYAYGMNDEGDLFRCKPDGSGIEAY